MGRPIYYSSDEEDCPRKPLPEHCRSARARAPRYTQRNPFRRVDEIRGRRQNPVFQGLQSHRLVDVLSLYHSYPEWEELGQYRRLQRQPLRGDVMQTDPLGRVYDSHGDPVPDLVSDSEEDDHANPGEGELQLVHPIDPRRARRLMQELFRPPASTELWAMGDARQRLREAPSGVGWYRPPEPQRRESGRLERDGPPSDRPLGEVWRALQESINLNLAGYGGRQSMAQGFRGGSGTRPRDPRADGQGVSDGRRASSQRRPRQRQRTSTGGASDGPPVIDLTAEDAGASGGNPTPTPPDVATPRAASSQDTASEGYVVLVEAEGQACM